MDKIVKYIILCMLLICAGVSGLFAQDITKFGVVDTSRVYAAYFRDTTPIRSYESKKAAFQKEVDKMTQELRDLQAKKLEEEKNGNDAAVLKLESQITQKTSYLTEYTNAKNIELESLRSSLESSDAFYKKLYDTLGRIAENGGYSMILSLQQANGILWYSPSVDITDQVISALGF